MQKKLDEAYATAIAIIGMSGRFPGARTVEAYWNNIAGGQQAIRFFSDEELLAAGVAQEEISQPGYVKAGAVVEDIEQFDAAFFGYTPREAEVMDPQQRIFLEVAWEALEAAGYDAYTYPGMIGVFAGSAISTYLLNNIFPQPEIVNLLGPLQTSLGNDKDSLATRVSYKLNLRGPGIAVQTYCSTSLVAVHLACQSLLSYESDMVLAGGVALAVPQTCGYLYQEGGILSPDGACRTFDAEARGSVMGNGAGVVVLKRLGEAVEDGDHIYAVIRGSAVNNDGHSRVSYTAPGLEGQSGVIIEALANAGVEAESISYIEAHGTATELGDSVELAAMTRAFELTTEKKQFCALGSVKPNVGHLDRASGVAGLIKTACALHHKQVPPSLHFTRPNPEVNLPGGPFYVNTTLAPWPQRHSPRRAGVSSFGLGGTNVHLVLEEAPVCAPGSVSRPEQLLVLSARTPTALEQMSANLAQHLREHPHLDLADIAYTLQVGRSVFPHRRALVCADREEAIEQLEQPLSASGGTRHDPAKERRVALLLAGTGEQYADMAHDLYTHEHFFREQVDRCLAILKQRAGLDLRALLFTGAHRRHEQRAGLDLRALLRPVAAPNPLDLQLRETRYAQPAIFVVEYALVQLLMHWGIQPQALLGYSLGEYVAACLCGVFSLEDALLLVARRAQWIGDQAPGAMLAVELSAAEVQPFVQAPIELAIVSGPQHCVLAGPPQAIADLAQQLQALEIAARPVETTHAFHTSMLAPVQEALTALAGSIQLHAPTIPYISNVTGTWITREQATDPAYWAEHMCQPVSFLQGIDTLVQEQHLVVVEIGLGQALSAAVREQLAARAESFDLVFSTLPSRYERQSDTQALLATLGKLWLAGVQPDWSVFYEHEQRLRVPLPTYPFERQRYWIDAPRGLGQPRTPPRAEGGKKATSADWFYLPLWRQTPLPEVGPLPDAGPCLVFLDPAGLGERLASELRGQGLQVIGVVAHDSFASLDARTYGLRPGEASDYEALSRELKRRQHLPRTIVHCWSVEREDPHSCGLEYFQSRQQTGFYSLLFFLQALSAQAYTQPLRIFVLSSHIHAVHGFEQLHPEKATILGLCRVVPQEYIDTICRNIDVLLPEGEEWDPRALAALLGEILSPCADPVVAYRGRTRWVQEYQAQRLAGEQEPTHAFRQQGVYLITGGLGGIGLYLAEYLATSVQATCVLLTRSPFPQQSEWDAWVEQHGEDDQVSGKIRRLQAIEQAGAAILLLNADVADAGQMRACIEQIYRQCGALHGVFHAAGSSAEIGFRAIQDLGQQGCETHFHPKVAGVFALQQALEGRTLDFCLVFSSLSAVLGGLGFAAYAAANLFMDAFISQQQAAALPWRCVNWDSWHVKDQVHGVLGATIASYEMTPQEGLEALVRAMKSGHVHLVNSTGDLQARLSQWIQTASQPEAAQAGAHPGTAIARPTLSTPYAPPENEIEERIVEIWEQLLGLEQIGIRDNFFELGGHSLTGTRLISRLRQTFQVNIPLASLFQASTVEDLALIVGELLLEEIEQAQRPLITHGGSIQ